MSDLNDVRAGIGEVANASRNLLAAIDKASIPETDRALLGLAFTLAIAALEWSGRYLIGAALRGMPHRRGTP